VNDIMKKDEHRLNECALIQIKPDCARRGARIAANIAKLPELAR
jgi:hypothetical protein